ncbi:hypothetical protein [Noviherbaspirillum pedocola]|uniref:Uncharacterized protein n=1 Tax=Noviherbaspirillum pedocola TaxID=2801341 RepID=A0A934SSU0_9BURK|nr:hypothetical protein [Noviherbaspirillum pedocola]MBK4736126.1 hypothetical protein [Noviherbaspirillum pedocola]
MATIPAHARFQCRWPVGYGDAQPADVDPAFFCDDNGYSDEDIVDIAALRVGETHTIVGAVHERHTITRLPDAIPTAASR